MVGLAIGASISNPGIAVPLSFVMHFMGDLVPHWDFYSNTTDEQRRVGWRPIAVMADLGLGVAVGMFFTLYALWVVGNTSLALNMFLCGVAAVLPDALAAPLMFTQKPNIISVVIGKIQSRLQFQAPIFWGLLTQVLITVFAFLVISNSLTQ
ncbi:hypothetical protein A2415_04130 [candidate division WWE3 bacterium RIFOXYC1_FULL_39_7]|uniref:Uncharacterized protein n=2 Tax=Katanobacteria TaxID=422282 RepID=A0A1F4X7F0_UNCKA|nr:MAG: hypothetical protein A2415_04130 [candidate division WWE3 bacterium RIFOXYC1_FULL_39_7]OGC77640.1 MAG: hypothetical protein A2619_05380 [candidate division WWE3 bacterium RIFOXYD1_FULL_39_9]